MWCGSENVPERGSYFRRGEREAIVPVLNRVKVKDVQQHLHPLLRQNRMKRAVVDFIEEYKRKQICASSIKPLPHVLIGAGVVSYFFTLPQAHRHVVYLEEVRKHGKD